MAGIEMARIVRRGGPGEPDIYGHVSEVRPFRWRWWLTSGLDATLSGPFHAWTQAGAWAKAVIAAQQVGR